MRNPERPRGPGQDALIVRPSDVEVPMGSLLNVIAVTVASNAPAALEGECETVQSYEDVR
jgi:hypothetical protein